MKPTVFLYNLPLPTKAAVEGLCREIGAEPRTVEEARQGLTLGALVGLLPELPGRERVPGEMLVMAYFDQKMLDAFLQGLRQKKVPPIPRKAMLTLANTPWTGLQLYRELSREMEEMERNRASAFQTGKGE